jgi:hypothetical protein
MKEAAQTLRKAETLNWDARALVWTALALTEHRLGHDREAQRWLARAGGWVEAIRPAQPGAAPPLVLRDWLELQVLLREARRAIADEEYLPVKPER